VAAGRVNAGLRDYPLSPKSNTGRRAEVVRYESMPEETPSTPPNDSDLEAEIARLAHRYYEEEGRPEGRAEEHWFRAEREIKGPVPPWTVESGAGDA